LNPNRSRGAFWKLRLSALALGILGVPFVYLIALKISDDLRLISVSGILFLFCAAALLGRRKKDWVCGILLIASVTAVFCYEVLNKIPALWPNLALWGRRSRHRSVFCPALVGRPHLVVADSKEGEGAIKELHRVKMKP
jgi:hypothetical protein